MTKKELMDMGLDEATADRVLAAHNETMKGFVPRSRLNEEITARKTAEELAATHEATIKTLRDSNKTEELRQEIEQLKSAHAAEIHRLKVDSAVDAALASARAKNPRAVKALLNDLDKAELDADGTVKGLAEQIEALQKAEDSKFLFDTAANRRMKGAKVGEDGLDDGDGAPDISKMSYAELAAYMNEHPEVTPE